MSGYPVLHYLLEFAQHMSIKSVMPSNRLIVCHPLLLLPSVFPSIRVFSNELAFLTKWPKYWSFSFNISPSHEYSGLISFRIDCCDLPAVQGTLKKIFASKYSKASPGVEHSASRTQRHSQLCVSCLMERVEEGARCNYLSFAFEEILRALP